MDRILAPDVADLLPRRDLPAPVRSAIAVIAPDDPIEVDEATALRAVEPLQWFTRRVGVDGLPLTKSGRLRPIDVNALMTELGWDSWWIGKNNREELTQPAGMLRQAAEAAKLVRKYRGSLRLTPAGRAVLDDPAGLWFHVAEQLPAERREGDRIASGLLMLEALVAANATLTAPLVAGPTGFEPAEALASLGWIGSDGAPLHPHDLQYAGERTDMILRSIRIYSYGRESLEAPDVVAFLRAALTRPVPQTTTTSTVRSRKRARSCHVITVQLAGVSPTVWRQIRVPSDITLMQLHLAIQAAMGWTCSHLFSLEPGGSVDSDYLPDPDLRRYGYPDPDFDLTVDAAAQTLDRALPRVGDRARYEYDFGDGWLHTLEVNAIETTDGLAGVLGGENACPPEDCGGPYGYQEFLAAQDNPDHEMYENFRDWLGYTHDPAAFNLAAADAELRRLKFR